jgi:nitrate/TMAO reductase-like tetraheme cytochrome c subunit
MVRTLLRRIGSALRKFFFPPEGSSMFFKVLPYGFLGVMSLGLLGSATYAWEYTNSPAFCGTSCHTMPPEYSSYLASPHARVDCVECHIGRDYIANRITRKAGDMKHVYATLFSTYEYPIRSKGMRPARETCEKCHYPEKFSSDSFKEIRQFLPDQENTPASIFLVMRVGGGSQREGLGRGIHWHIENQVLYYPQDKLEQVIPYVRVVNTDGSFTEFVDVESGFDPSQVKEADLKEMDCITCHNRITHIVYQPEETINQLLARGLISNDIPDIRAVAEDVYSRIYETTEKGLNGIAGLASYYQTYYPEFYAARQADIDAAIEVLQENYARNVYPEQKADWNTHFNNVGHKFSPGCFRCHGGQHLNEAQESIRLECNLCHSIPVVADKDDFLLNIEISRGPEPLTHLESNWISIHHAVIDGTCSNCHTTANPGGSDNTSFCSNSACHSSVWDYAGFDAPALREILQAQLPPTPTPAPLVPDENLSFENGIGDLLERRCAACHNAGNAPKGLNLSTYASLMAGGTGGPAVVAGDPQASLIIQFASGDKPHFSSFNTRELQQVTSWILKGAPEK